MGLLLPKLTSGAIAIPRLDQHPVGASVRPTVVVLTLAVFANQCAPVDGCRAAPHFDRARHKLPVSVVRLRHFVFAPHHETPRHFFRLAISTASRPVWVGFANSRARGAFLPRPLTFFSPSFSHGSILQSRRNITAAHTLAYLANKKNPARGGAWFSRDSTNWGRGLAPRDVPKSRILPRITIHRSHRSAVSHGCG